jgi:hypothetical protein
MRGSSSSNSKNIKRFWLQVFAPTARDVVMHTLATCGGLFALEQRELAPEYGGGGVNGSSSSSYRERFDCYRTVADVWQRVDDSLHFSSSQPIVSLHMGAIFPAHHLRGQPVRRHPTPQDAFDCPAYMSILADTLKPREFEREGFKLGVHSVGPMPMGEFVVDIDLDEHYNRAGICGCGVQKRVCDACWETFMTPAQIILKRLLCELLGFRAVFSVFSGRRGFHTWVVDRRAYLAAPATRAAWVVAIETAHTHLAWIYEYLAPLFDGNPALRARYVAPADPHLRVDAHRAAVMEALYPKLDRVVSLDPAHLHKAPLVPHPETGNVCVVMGDARGRRKFVPSEDTMHVSNAEVGRMAVFAEYIRKVVELGK